MGVPMMALPLVLIVVEQLEPRMALHMALKAALHLAPMIALHLHLGPTVSLQSCSDGCSDDGSAIGFDRRRTGDLVGVVVVKRLEPRSGMRRASSRGSLCEQSAQSDNNDQEQTGETHLVGSRARANAWQPGATTTCCTAVLARATNQRIIGGRTQ